MTNPSEMTDQLGEYGIVANAMADEPVFRLGAKVWLCRGDNGDGFESRIFRELSKKGSNQPIEKWARTIHFHNFRAAWIPPTIQHHIHSYRGSRSEVEIIANELNALIQQRRLERQAKLQITTKDEAIG